MLFLSTPLFMGEKSSENSKSCATFVATFLMYALLGALILWHKTQHLTLPKPYLAPMILYDTIRYNSRGRRRLLHHDRPVQLPGGVERRQVEGAGVRAGRRRQGRGKPRRFHGKVASHFRAVRHRRR